MAQVEAQAHAPHVVVLTSPGAGHVVPVAELAARLAAHHGVTATVVTFTNHSSPEHSSALATLPAGVSVAKLPEVSLDDLPADAHLATLIATVVQRTLPHLRDLLRSLLDSPAGVAAFVTDMLCPAALSVAEELGVPRFVFYTSSLMSLVTLLYTPELARTTACECRDLPEPVRLPGCIPLRGADLIECVQHRGNPVFAHMVDLGLDYLRADGFIVNTFGDMEHDTLVAFKELSDKGVYPPAYAVGPLVRPCSDDQAAEHACMTWLDGQPEGSVLYVCFGSGGTLSTEQTAELAAGLEASGQRFLWVVRFPSDRDSGAGCYFGRTDHGDDPLSCLLEGFTERTRTTGHDGANPMTYINAIPDLDGNNYGKWFQKLEIALTMSNIDLAITTESPKEPEKPVRGENEEDAAWAAREDAYETEYAKYDIAKAQWNISNRKCLMIIKGTITDAIRLAIPDCVTATEYLDKVKSQFTGSSKASAATLAEKLMSKKYSGGGIREHILEMSHMANKLKSMDMPLPDSFLVQLVFKSLPKEFATFHVNYNTFPENWDIEKLIAMCVQEEERLKASYGGEFAFQVQQKKRGFQNNKKPFPPAKNQNESGSSKAPQKTLQKNWDNFPVERDQCLQCKKRGHYKKDCPEFLKELLKNGGKYEEGHGKRRKKH